MDIRALSPGTFDQVARLEVALQPDDAWTAESLRSLYQGRVATGFGVLGLYVDDVLACYLIYQALDVAEVLRIGTALDYQRQGLAEALLSHWLKTLKLNCLLEVRADNAPAIALYHKLGFVRIHIRRAYYKSAQNRQNRIDAWIMQRSGSS